MSTSQQWTNTPLKDYVVLPAWTEHYTQFSPTFHWRYYLETQKMLICDSLGPLEARRQTLINQKEFANARFNQIITKKDYTITSQETHFSGSNLEEIRQYPEGGKTKKFQLKDIRAAGRDDGCKVEVEIQFMPIESLS